MSAFHPDLAFARFIPQVAFPLPVVELLARIPPRRRPAPEDLLVDDVHVPGPAGAPDVEMRVYRPRSAVGAVPALLWIHGGGMVLGDHLQDEASNIRFARTLGIVVASVRYRLAPSHRAPAAVEDAHAALLWLHAHAAERGIDPDRIAVGGASAGGGIAAATALMAHDRGTPAPALQLLVYPMLDDRTVTRTDMDTSDARIWTPGSNRMGWTAYLGRPPGSPDVDAYAAPARREDLSGLPPAWIGVGSLDLFRDEDAAYAERLRAAGCAVELHVVDGAFHGFDAVFPGRGVSREFWRAQAAALRGALRPGG
jgi:acetyl esterase/lipase